MIFQGQDNASFPVTIGDVRKMALSCPWKITEIYSGGAKGVDAFGERFAEEVRLPLFIFEADWKRFGKSAGYKRNVDMAREADALIALWDGQSKGTLHMINIAEKFDLETYISRQSCRCPECGAFVGTCECFNESESEE